MSPNRQLRSAESGAAVEPPQNNAIPTAYVRPEKAEQLRRALPVLLAARRSIVLGGHREVINEIQVAGNSGIECHWARGILLEVVPAADLIAWQSNLSIRQSDITRALDRAISIARRGLGSLGGWRTSAGPNPKGEPMRPALSKNDRGAA